MAKQQVETSISNSVLKCKYCGSQDVTRYGRFRGVQRWWCKQCQRKFAHQDSIPGMQASINLVSLATSMYFRGKSLSAIRSYLERYHDYPISESTLYDWLIRFTKMAVNRSAECRPCVGDIWIAYERVTNTPKRERIFWDMLDSETGFLIASHVSMTDTAREALDLWTRAIDRSGKRPNAILLGDHLICRDRSHLVALRNRLKIRSLLDDRSTAIMETFRSTLQSRDRLLQRVKKQATIKLLLEGWQVQYNFFRTCRLLGNRTPAEAAGITLQIDSIEDIKDRCFSKGQSMGEDVGLFLDEIGFAFPESQGEKFHTKPKTAGDLSWEDAILFLALADKITKP